MRPLQEGLAHGGSSHLVASSVGETNVEMLVFAWEENASSFFAFSRFLATDLQPAYPLLGSFLAACASSPSRGFYPLLCR